jgi:predicted permease
MLLILRPVRVLTRYWKLSMVAIFSLSVAMALGIISLSLMNTFFLLPPAAPAADRLVMIHSRFPGEEIGQFSYPDYEYYREKNTVFTDVAAVPNNLSVGTNFDGKREVKVVGRRVSDNYFSVLGIRPYLGNFFSPGDDGAKAAIAVMTYACWQRLGADPDIVGKTIGDYTIIGVTPPEFTGSFFGLNGDLLTALSKAGDAAASFTNRDKRQVFLLGRLKPGVTKAQAQAEMSLLAKQLASAYPKEDKDVVPVVIRATMLTPSLLTYAEIGASILMLVVLLVLLIACANVANLLLAVAVGRRQEAAIKVALGAPRSRLIREFLKETALICAASTGFGYLIAAALISRFAELPLILPMIGSYSLRIDLRLDATVIAFTAGLTLVAILATGLAPALYASSPNLAQILSSEIAVGGTRKNRRRNLLVVAQVAVCTLILVGLGLCQRSLYNLRHSDPGFAARNLVGVLVLPHEDVSEAGMKELRRKAREVVSALPGVESVSLAKDLPLGLGYKDSQAQLPESDRKIAVADTVVDADYFSTLRIPIVKGRVFDSRDRENNPDVVVINRTMAETFWPGQDPVGRTVMAGDPVQQATVIGVVGDCKYESLDDPARPAMYYALSQHYVPQVSLIARTGGDPRLWVEPVSDSLRAVGVFVFFPPVTYNELLNFTLLMERFVAGAVAVLSGLALLLAVLGLLGSISYSVSERKRELGIRVALGARSSELLGMILRQTLRTTGSGIGIGILFGIVATIVLRSQFYGIGFIEWTVLVAVGAGMLGVSLLVASLSAVPWLRVDPMEAVRHT